jgi:hypothetical protein
MLSCTVVRRAQKNLPASPKLSAPSRTSGAPSAKAEKIFLTLYQSLTKSLYHSLSLFFIKSESVVQKH